MSQEPISIIATLKNIIFYRDNFLISKFSYEEKQGMFVAKGVMLTPEPGLAYKLRGNWETHPEYGQQLAFGWYELMQPKNTEGIFKYLVYVCKWVGPTIAGRILDKYGDDTLNVLKTAPSRVAIEVPGLTKDRAKDIQIALLEHGQDEAAVIELQELFAPIEGLPKRLAFDWIKSFGAKVNRRVIVKKLKDNPYLLTRIKGVGFLIADKVALSLGIDKRAQSRQMACIMFVIQEQMKMGHLWVERQQLIEEVVQKINICEPEMFDLLLADSALLGKNDHYALYNYAINEDFIVENLIAKQSGGAL